MTIRRKLRLNWELLCELTRRETRRRYKDTILGWLWIILIPILQSAVISYLFVKLAGIDFGSSEQTYFLIVLSGFTVWNFVSHTVSQAMSALSGNLELINTQPLNIALLPLSGVAVKTIDWVIDLLSFIILLTILFQAPGVTFFIGILPLAISLILFVAGLSLLAAMVGVLVRDAGHLISLFLSIWFWTSPIFYPAARISSQFAFINLNPLVHFLAAFRQMSLDGTVDADKIAKLFIASLVFFAFSLLVFRRQTWRVYDQH